MRKLLYLLIFMYGANAVQAQNITEAKIAFELAEEKFDSEQYTDALDLLEKAETALGKINPPMAYLKVMILDQIAYANQKDVKGKEAFENLEKAVASFEKTDGIEGLGEEKLKDVYRIKIELEKRSEAYTKWLVGFTDPHSVFVELAKRISAQFPKTGITVGEFVTHPFALESTPYGRKMTEKQVNRFVKVGEGFFTGTVTYLKPNEIHLRYLETTEKGVDNVQWYMVEQHIKKVRQKTGEDYALSPQHLIELFTIPKALWDGITREEDTYIRTDKKRKGYQIFYESDEKMSDGKPKRLSVFIDNTIQTYNGHENIMIRVLENTL